MKTKLAIVSSLISATAMASSHREAPAIAQDPSVDITDVYAFKSPDVADTMTLMMNVSPGYLPIGGPNWYQFADNALYELHIDSTGDGVEDVTYQFRFKTNAFKTQKGLIVANFPSIEFKDGKYTGSLNQTYDVYKVVGPRRGPGYVKVASNLPVAPPRLGPATTDGGLQNADNPDAMYDAYSTLAANAISKVGASKFFAGPRNDPFFVDLGGVFDRVSVRIPGLSGTPKDALAGLNVLTIAVQVPYSEILLNGQRNFGVWATTSRRLVTVKGDGTMDDAALGSWVQVSRLGNPLVNEVVIKFEDKDRFNGSIPSKDAANYASYVLNPQLASVLNALYGPKGSTAPGLIQPIADTNRTDLVAAFVDGLPGINRHPKAKTNAGDMIRVNLDFPIQEWPLSGRQLNDDVVKSSLVFLAQCKNLTGNTGAPANPYGVYGLDTANCILDDFITADDKTPGGDGHLAAFPYIDAPFSAYGQKN